MSIAATAPRFSLLIVGALMVVLAAIGAILTAQSPAEAAPAKTDATTQVAVFGGLTGATATGAGGTIG